MEDIFQSVFHRAVHANFNQDAKTSERPRYTNVQVDRDLDLDQNLVWETDALQVLSWQLH